MPIECGSGYPGCHRISVTKQNNVTRKRGNNMATT